MNLKEVGIEFEDLGRDGPFNKINHGGNYLWHVARKLASIWMDNKVDNLVIFSPRFDRRCYKYDPQAREFDPNEDAEDNHFVKIMRLPWHVTDSKEHHRTMDVLRREMQSDHGDIRARAIEVRQRVASK